MANSDTAGGVIFLGLVGVAVWYFAIRDSDWAARDYARKHYMLSDSKIVIEKRPHDCDFLTAPIGTKHCSYKREYLVEWYMLSPTGAHHPIEYATVQERPPPQCWEPDPACPEIDNLQPDEHPSVFFGWQARSVQIRWRKVEE